MVSYGGTLSEGSPEGCGAVGYHEALEPPTLSLTHSDFRAPPGLTPDSPPTPLRWDWGGVEVLGLSPLHTPFYPPISAHSAVPGGEGPLAGRV